MDKPTMNYAVAYQRFRADLNRYIVQLQKEYPIPSYMVEGILGGLLSDVRSAVIAETVTEEKAFIQEIEEYHDKREETLNDELTELKAKNEI